MLRRSILKATSYAAIALVAGYALVLSGLAIGWALLPDRYWWLKLSNAFALVLFLPLPLFVPLGLLLRSPVARVAAMLLVLLFGVEAGQALVPDVLFDGVAPPNGGSTIRVLTFNQLYKNDDPAGTFAVIKNQDADIIGLQELSYPLARLIKRDPSIKAGYPYRALRPLEGLGVLSRYPITSEKLVPGLPIQIVELEISGKAVHVINTHPLTPAFKARRLGDLPLLRQIPLLRTVPLVRGYDTTQRDAQLQRVLDLIDSTPGPLIVVGDFNTPSREGIRARFAAQLLDAYEEVGWGFGNTYPNGRSSYRLPILPPLVRIDYIWTRRDMPPRAANVVCAAAGSDHCMLIADVAAPH